MAVAAYASLVSLTNVLDNVHYHAELRRLHVDIKQIEALQGRVNSLLEFLEVHSQKKGERIEDLRRQTSVVAFEAEEIFDLHVVNQLQLEDQGDGSDLAFSAFTEEIEGLIQKIDIIKNELLAAEEVLEDLRIDVQPRVSQPTGGASASYLGGRNTIVGFDEHIVRIMDVLTRDESNLEILPIVGMGGIGKTTLAKKVFDDPCIVEHFDLRIWLTISQKYSVYQILRGLLNDGEVEQDDGNLDRLGEVLYKKLFGRRYLIVLDDVWIEQAWSDLRMFFPNNFNRSRVMVTTRISHVANSLGSHNLYSMTCLDENESWDLFCQTIFAQKDCPYSELEEIGRKIVESCKGLPLEIIVIGGLLAKSDMRKEHWKEVSDNVSSFANLSDDEHCLKILRLSYDSLPIHLKPCLLSMRVVDEDDKMPVLDLIQHWLVEDFIKTKGDECLEEIAREYVKDLVDRNLFFIHEWNSDGEIETCGIHDLIRDLCLTESNKEHFLLFPRMETIDEFTMSRSCFICSAVVEDNDGTNLGATVLISPSISQDNIPVACGGCKTTYSHAKELRWVKVLDNDENGLHFIAQHTKLRGMVVSRDSHLKFVSPPTIHFLWNLQALVLIGMFDLPCEIWEMPRLRSIQGDDVGLPDPPTAHSEKEDFFILKNLYTLFVVRDFKCTNEVPIRIPNLKVLRVKYMQVMEWSNASLHNLVQFQKLESLSLSVLEGSNLGEIEIAFPLSLKILSLEECKFPLADMSIIGSLPNLERLYLDCAANESMWNPIEGEFLRLKELSIKCEDLVQWTAEESHFPNLELLQLRSLRSLEEIPLGIGDIPTLRKIMLHKCSISAIKSAHRIWEDQQSLGNDTLQILVYPNYDSLSISDFMPRTTGALRKKIITKIKKFFRSWKFGI